MINYLKKINKENKEIVFFGASHKAKTVLKFIKEHNIKIDYFCDNNKIKWNKFFEGYKIISVDMLKKMDRENTIIVITSVYINDIMRQLQQYGFKEIYSFKDFYNQKREKYDKLIFPQFEDIEVSILLTTYNEWNYTYNCLSSILEFKTNCHYEVIVGDNVSEDETKNINNYVSNIRVYRHSSNLHYLKNCNTIAQKARGKYLLLLSNDTLIQTDYWLDKLILRMQNDNKIGMIGVNLYLPESSFYFPGSYIAESKQEFTTYRGLKEFKEVDYVCPACAMVRSDLWNEIGGYDERYCPAWFEDADFMMSIRKLGYKVMFEPSVVVWHHGEVTYSKSTDNISKIHEEHKIIFFNRWKDDIKELRKKNAIENISDEVKYYEYLKYGQVGKHGLYMDLLVSTNNYKVKNPCIIWIRGGAWCNHDYTRAYGPNEELTSLVKKGYIIVSIDYRLTDEAPFPAQLEDCKCAVRYLRANATKYGIDEERIFAWGESAGGNLAALMGTTNDQKELEGNGGYSEYNSRINGVCAWYPPTKLDELRQTEEGNYLLNCLLQDEPNKHSATLKLASPYYHISENTVPFLVMHGTDDNVVPLDQSEKFVDRLKMISKNKVEFVKIQGQGHGFFEGHEYYEMVKNFFDQI